MAENKFLYAAIGKARKQMGDYKGAIVALKKAMKFNPNKAIIYIHSGQSKHFLGDYQGSISDYSKAIKLKPEDGYSYYLRAFAYFSQKDSANGCRNLEEASKYGFNTSKEIEKYCQKLVLRDGYKNLRYSS
ncbi:tetratricopeptide repeat protein [Prochlorococcus marinus]|uniref:tetratricopeptide repeat protein n=1 Tax=Prochlorococcus marinus TaxID=1219 RepID=UPI0022B43609|nr:tetratricopeptide repeat protein [Prochlorococcus marinus]